jgi:uncharacterized membrane protein
MNWRRVYRWNGRESVDGLDENLSTSWISRFLVFFLVFILVLVLVFILIIFLAFFSVFFSGSLPTFFLFSTFF